MTDVTNDIGELTAMSHQWQSGLAVNYHLQPVTASVEWSQRSQRPPTSRPGCHSRRLSSCLLSSLEPRYSQHWWGCDCCCCWTLSHG